MAVVLEIIIDEVVVGGDTRALITAKADAVLIPDYERSCPSTATAADIGKQAEVDLFGPYIWTVAPTVTDNRGA